MKATKNYIRVLYVVFLLSLAVIPARAQEWSSNLLVNPGAETGDLTGWTENNHFFSTTRVRSGTGLYLPHSGQYEFTTVLGDQANYGSLSQYVDVSNYSSCIDSGNSHINAGVWAMAEQVGSPPDSCKLTVQFFSDNGQLLGQSTTGEISNAGWKEYNLSGSIPSGTRTLKVVLEGFLHYGGWPDSYFDDAYVYVSECPEMSGIRIIDTIPTNDVEFVLSSVTKEPYSVSTEGDKTIVEWRYDRFEIGQSESISFYLNLYNLVPNEDRLVDHKLEVIYNDKNGKEVRYELPSLYVHVLNSAFDSTISTDKTAYTANEEVKIDASITNLSGYERSVDARVRIEDSTGAVIKEVANVSLGFGVPAPTVDPVISPTTYKTITLSGTKAAETSIVINEVEVAALDGSTTWQGSYTLQEGDNNLSITTRNSYGSDSDPVIISVTYLAPIAVWHMDDNWDDSSGNRNNGTAYNGAAFSTDAKVGTHSGSFDGVNDYVSVDSGAGLDCSQPFTIEAWVNLTALQSNPSGAYYYRDARDFAGISSGYNAGRWGWDAYAGGWSSSSGHGSSYTSASHITGYSNLSNFYTVFDNVIPGRYYIWLYVNGGNNETFLDITINNSSYRMSLATPNSWSWQKVGTYYNLDSQVTIKFNGFYTNYLYGIRGIYITADPSTPTYVPPGNKGDVIYSGSVIFSKISSDGKNGCEVSVDLNGKVYLTLLSNGGYSNAESNNVISIGGWYHIVGTYDGTNTRVYVNVTVAGEAMPSAAPLSFVNKANIGVRNYMGTLSNPWNGLIDDVAIYDRVLTEDEIKALYDANSQSTVNPVPQIITSSGGTTKRIENLVFHTGSTLAGNYKAHLILYENRKQVGEASTSFEIQPAAIPANRPPVVEAGPDQTVNRKTGVNFSGSFTDPGSADTHAIAWDFGDGTSSSGTLTPAHTYANSGSYPVTLTVTDDESSVGQDTLVVTVNNLPPVADAGPGQSVEQKSAAGTPVTLDGSGSSDPESDPLTYRWTWPGGSATGVNPTVTLPLGTTITLVVNDGQVDSKPDQVVIVVRDVTPPTTAATPSAGPNPNGWSNTDVTVNLSAVDNDGGSGVKEIPYTLSGAQTGGGVVGGGVVGGSSASVTILAEGETTLTYFAWDNAGNQEDPPKTLTIRIDKTAPVVTASRTPGPNANEWNNADVTAHFEATDNLSGIQGDSFFDVFFTLEGAGQSATHTFADLAGNSTSATVSGIHIDKTPPAITGSQTPGPNPNGWNNTDVTVSFNCSDGLSGVESCSVPVTLTAEGAGQSSTGTAEDRAGNRATATASGINIDKTPPVISGLPAPGCTLWPPNHRLVQVATVAASDGLSGMEPGLPVVAGTSNEPEDGLGDGDLAPDILIAGGSMQLRAERSGTGTGRLYTLTATSSDLAGNGATATATCTVPHDQGKK